MVSIEVLEVIVEEGENDIWLGCGERLSQLSARGLGLFALVWLGCLGEANGSCDCDMLEMVFLGVERLERNVPGAWERPMPATILPIVVRLVLL